MGVPEAPLNEGKEAELLRQFSGIAECYSLHLTGITQRHEEKHIGAQAVFFSPYAGVTHPVAARIILNIGLNRFPPGRPYRAIIIDVRSICRHHPPVRYCNGTGNPAEAGIAVEAVPTPAVLEIIEKKSLLPR
jgi:hypothetical protein